MSSQGSTDQTIRDLTSAIQNLSLVVDRLTSPSSDLHTESPADEWEVVEAPETPLTEHFREQGQSLSFRGPEEGPPPLPSALRQLAERRLSNVSIGSARRAERAFSAGFWAHIAIDTHTEYICASPVPEVKISQFVCLACETGEPFRTHTKFAFDSLARARGAKVCEKFGSLTELHLFCLGAGRPIPELLQPCKKQK